MNIEQEIMYTGWKKWYPTNDEWSVLATFSGDISLEIVQKDFPELKLPDLTENEYLLVYDEDNKLKAHYCKRGDHLKKFGRNSIKNRFLESALKPVNDEQVAAFDLMCNDNITVKVLTGNYGSGKTMLLVNQALNLLEHNKVKRIIWLRNNIAVEDTGNLGALPGTEFEKLLPFLGPMIDHVGSEQDIQYMVEKRQLQVPFLGHIRGRNITDSIIICTEAQNLTMKQIKLILGRVAKGSQVWFDGDWRQHDGKAFKKAKSLRRLTNYLKGNPLFGYVHLQISERSETAKLADILPDDED